jgi:hypothetical protein
MSVDAAIHLTSIAVAFVFDHEMTHLKHGHVDWRQRKASKAVISSTKRVCRLLTASTDKHSNLTPTLKLHGETCATSSPDISAPRATQVVIRKYRTLVTQPPN